MRKSWLTGGTTGHSRTSHLTYVYNFFSSTLVWMLSTLVRAKIAEDVVLVLPCFRSAQLLEERYGA